jgi:hypothetical protein
MRRNIVCALLFALALAVQAFAPAAARVAMGVSQQTCVNVSVDGSAAKGQPSGHSDANSARCDLCPLCCGSLAPLGARAAAILPASFAWTEATWPIVENATSSTRRDTVRARAPPTFS